MSHTNENPAACEPGAAGPPKDGSDHAQLPTQDKLAPSNQQAEIAIPDGLLGEFAKFNYEHAVRPVEQIAVAGALATLACITGRAYNVSGTGTNVYIGVLAPTGFGKDNIHSAHDALFRAVIDNSSLRREAVGAFAGCDPASAQGLLGFMANGHLSLRVSMPEMAKQLAIMCSPKGPTHQKELERLYLRIYSKSGEGETVEGSAYSDKLKNTSTLVSPALTLIGEGTPERFYELLNDEMVMSGFVGRFSMFEYRGIRQYHRHNALRVVPDDLWQRTATLMAICNGYNESNRVCHVGFDDEAGRRFDLFDIETTDEINRKNGDIYANLWGRAHLKALKLAALWAIGVNPFRPTIDLAAAQWAIDISIIQTQRLLAKFADGETGTQGGNQSKQEREAIRVIAEYGSKPWADCAKYHGTEEMHRAGVITQAHIQQRLSATVAFRDDPRGPKDALTRTLKSLLEADILREIPNAQMIQMFGKHPRAFAVSDPAAILKSAKGSF